MGSRSRIVLALVAAALATASAAAAAGSWPKLERRAADQALADRSILHLTDFAPGSGRSPAPTPSSGNLHDPACGGRVFSDEGSAPLSAPFICVAGLEHLEQFAHGDLSLAARAGGSCANSPERSWSATPT